MPFSKCSVMAVIKFFECSLMAVTKFSDLISYFSDTVTRGGSCATINEIQWNLPSKEVELRRFKLLKRKDSGRVYTSLQGFVGADKNLIKTVKSYLFDCPGISFVPNNYYAWNRLAQKKGTIDDVRFFVHEMTEVKELQALQIRTKFDYMGTNHKNFSRREQTRWYSDFETYYLEAHSRALEAEYKFIAEQIRNATKDKVQISLEEAASIDETRREARDFMHVNGVLLKDHHNFCAWQQRAKETVALTQRVKKSLRLSSDPTLAVLINELKRLQLNQVPWG